jgi:hypothetical protein
MFDPSYRGSVTATRLIPSGREEKRIGETKNESIFGVSPVDGGFGAGRAIPSTNAE